MASEMFPLSDIEVDNMILEEWMGVLASLWELTGKPVDSKRLKLYQRNLSNVPLGLLEKSIDRVFRENTYQTVPVTGVIWDAVKKELHNPADLERALETWEPEITCSWKDLLEAE